MEVVKTRDGQTVELQECPPWCMEEHHLDPNLPAHPSDGFHHYGEPIVVDTTDVVNLFDGTTVAIRVCLKSWTCPLDAAPGPAMIGLDIDFGDGSVDLTPAEARRVAEILIKLSDRARMAT